ncbi:MAG: hypothetical protein AABX00_01695 [Nanoarchaeota archaeon]
MDELEFEKDLGDLVERTISSGNPTVQYYLEAIPAIFDYLRLTGRVKTQTDFAKFIGTDASRLSRILNWKQSSKKVLKDPPPVQLYRAAVRSLGETLGVHPYNMGLVDPRVWTIHHDAILKAYADILTKAIPSHAEAAKLRDGD